MNGAARGGRYAEVEKRECKSADKHKDEVSVWDQSVIDVDALDQIYYEANRDAFLSATVQVGLALVGFDRTGV